MTVASPGDLGACVGSNQFPGHLVLLVTGPAGYRSFCRLSSLIQGRSDLTRLSGRFLQREKSCAYVEGGNEINLIR